MDEFFRGRVDDVNTFKKQCSSFAREISIPDDSIPLISFVNPSTLSKWTHMTKTDGSANVLKALARPLIENKVKKLYKSKKEITKERDSLRNAVETLSFGLARMRDLYGAQRRTIKRLKDVMDVVNMSFVMQTHANDNSTFQTAFDKVSSSHKLPFSLCSIATSQEVSKEIHNSGHSKNENSQNGVTNQQNQRGGVADSDDVAFTSNQSDPSSGPRQPS
eukprot:GDKK01035679.1.p1 GENE.GDKK01035679.1~~GDKK01035679.1.p1  ORF type:complete len:252 (-),score=37.41 GDKK01035679.1:5-661(-)